MSPIYLNLSNLNSSNYHLKILLIRFQKTKKIRNASTKKGASFLKSKSYKTEIKNIIKNNLTIFKIFLLKFS